MIEQSKAYSTRETLTEGQLFDKMDIEIQPVVKSEQPEVYLDCADQQSEDTSEEFDDSDNDKSYELPLKKSSKLKRRRLTSKSGLTKTVLAVTTAAANTSTAVSDTNDSAESIQSESADSEDSESEAALDEDMIGSVDAESSSSSFESKEEFPHQLVDDWHCDLQGFPDVPPFTGTSGLFLPEGTNEPMDIFNIFFSTQILSLFAKETNLYAKTKITAKHDSFFAKKWKDTTPNEIRGFLALLLHMSVVKKPSISDYWSTDIFIHSPFAATIMSRMRFQLLLSAFHIADNACQLPVADPQHDPLHKIRYFYEHLRRLFKSLCTPTKKICIGEAKCFKVYMKDKPSLRGIKMYELCETSSSYVFDFELYASESGLSNKPVDVCVRLLQPLFNQGYWCYTSSYYSCPELSKCLLQHGTMTVGTVYANRKGMPKDLTAQKLSPGETAFRRQGNLAVLKWKDKREVSLITTAHNPSTMVEVQTRTRQQIKPEAIIDYFHNTSGVDINDQFIARVPLTRRSLKWWRKLFCHLFTLTVIQSHILHQKLLVQNGKQPLKLNTFISQLGKALTQDYFSKQRTETSCAPRKCVDSMKRLTARHFPSHIPPTASNSKPRRRCTVCVKKDKYKNPKNKKGHKGKMTSYWCKECQVPLCIERCYELYHTTDRFWYQV